MTSIPPDIYEHVHALSLAIANASGAGDDALTESLSLSLRDYFDEQTATGRSHPFLTEATADFTEDAMEAVRLYQLALEQARAFPDEPTHTKMISLAERLLSLGQADEARKCLHDGRVAAIDRGDTFWVEQADHLLHELDS